MNENVRGLVGALIAIRDAELFSDGVDADLHAQGVTTMAEAAAAGRRSVFDELASHGIDLAALAQPAVACFKLTRGDVVIDWIDGPITEGDVAKLREVGFTVDLAYTTPVDSAPLVEALERLAQFADASDDAQYGTLGTNFVRDIARAALAAAGG